MAFTGPQSDPDLTDQCFLEDVAVFSLNTDLGIFYQKSIIFIHGKILFGALYLLSAQDSLELFPAETINYFLYGTWAAQGSRAGLGIAISSQIF